MSQKILIQWKTNDKWNGCEQRVNRKNVKPLDAALEKGQSVKILFNRRWFDGEVCEAWCPASKGEMPKGNV